MSTLPVTMWLVSASAAVIAGSFVLGLPQQYVAGHRALDAAQKASVAVRKGDAYAMFRAASDQGGRETERAQTHDPTEEV